MPLIDEKLMYFSCLPNKNSENVKSRIRGLLLVSGRFGGGKERENEKKARSGDSKK